MVSDKKSGVNNLAFLYRQCIISLALFLFLVFQKFNDDVFFFEFIIFGFHTPSWIYSFVSLGKFRKLWTIISLNIFQAHPLSLFLWDANDRMLDI